VSYFRLAWFGREYSDSMVGEIGPTEEGKTNQSANQAKRFISAGYVGETESNKDNAPSNRSHRRVLPVVGLVSPPKCPRCKPHSGSTFDYRRSVRHGVIVS